MEQPLEPEIIYEDKNFLAVNKPSGLLVHGVGVKSQESRVAEPTLVDWLLKRYPEIKNVGDHSDGRIWIAGDRRAEARYSDARPGIVHRLDKDTSGIMVVARTQASFEYLKSLFQTRQIRKTYRALVFGAIKEKTGIIEKPIGIKNGTLKRSVRSEKMAKEAITEYKVIKIYSLLATPYSLLEVQPKTGRTHQIRVHLASIGHPIVGDRLYGPKRQPDWATRLMLHATTLEFTTLEGHRMKLEAEPPEDFKEALATFS